MAADMPIKAPPPPVAYYDWSGAYIGFNAGSVWPQIDQTFPNRCRGTAGKQANLSTSPSDGIFGFHAGAQWQWGAWVLGAEAALSGCFNECRSHERVLPPPGFARQHVLPAQDHQPVHGGSAAGLCLGSLDDLRDRRLCLGRSQDHVARDAYQTLRRHRFNGASRNNGWYAGGGIDYMVHEGPLVDVMLGVEYQHFDVGSKNAFCFNPGLHPRPDGTKT